MGRDTPTGLSPLKLRAIQTIAGTMQSHGGTSRSVPALCDSLAEHRVDVHLITGIPADPLVACNFPKDESRVHTTRESAWLRQFGVTKGFKRHLKDLCGGCPERCIVHDHGLWLATNHGVATQSSRLGIKRIVSPRGMLSRWALGRRRIRKRVTWQLYQHKDLQSATAFVATSQAEAEDIRGLGLDQPIAVIPNGISLPDKLPPRTESHDKQVLCLSRIHPVKGLDNLLHAFHEARLPEAWKLVLAGPDENGHQAELLRLVKQLGLERRVSFAGPIDDQQKWQFLVDADLFVLPSHTENFGISVAEAMAAGLPVITTTGTPWSVIQDRSMGWWVEPQPGPLKRAITQACALECGQRREMGRRASEYARDAFTWKEIGFKMAEFYRWVLEPCSRAPEFIASQTLSR